MKHLFYSAILFVCCCLSYTNAQTISYTVNGTDLYADDGSGCQDCPCFPFVGCTGDPDPDWNARVNDNINNSWSNWSVSLNDNGGCNWYGISNPSWRSESNTNATTLNVQLNAEEDDAFGCGTDDDGECGGYSTIKIIDIKTNQPCTWHSYTEIISCSSDGDTWDWGVEWEYRYEFDDLNPGSITGDQTICAGGDPSTLNSNASATMYADYQWQYQNGCSGSWTDITGATNASFDPPSGLSQTRCYRRKATDCSGRTRYSDTVTVTVNQASTAPSSASASPSSICTGDLATLTQSGGSLAQGAQWFWYKDGCGTTLVATSSSPNASINVSPTTTTTYYVRAEGNCTTTNCASVTVNVSTGLSIDSFGVSNTTCFGGSDGEATVFVSGGLTPYSYNWTPGSGSKTNSGISAGNYSVTVTDDGGCSVTSNTTVNQPPKINITNISTQDIDCFGDSTGSITIFANGGSGSLEYSVDSGTTYTPSNTFNNLPAGTYNVSIKDSNGCAVYQTAIIDQPSQLTINEAGIQDVSCNGGNDGAIDITVNGSTPPYTYNWSTSASTEDVSGLSAGTYTVTVNDANGCSASNSFTVNEPSSPLSLSLTSNDISCFGADNGTATANVSGGTQPYEYLWSNFATTQSIDSLEPGTYTIIVTDSNGCTTNGSVTIDEPASQITLSANVTDVSCNGDQDGSIEITGVNNATQPYTYNWSNGGSGSTITNLEPGSYTVTLTDDNGCQRTNTYVVEEPSAIAVNVDGNDISCKGSTDGFGVADVSGGTGNYSYTWSTTPQQSGNIAKNLSAGTYEVTVSDANGCSDTASTTITEPSEKLTLSGVPDGADCFESATAEVTLSASGGSGGYQYTQDGVAYQHDSIFTGLEAGVKSFQVEDTNGCQASTVITILEPDEFTVELDEDITIPKGGKGQLQAVTKPDSFSLSQTEWKPAEGLSCTDCLQPVVSPDETTTYELTVYNENDCPATDTVEVEVSNDYRVDVPSAFSPNGDGENDILRVFTFGVEQVDIKIHNRWGEQMYEQTDVQPGDGWDGTTPDGEDAQVGTYVYVAEATFVNGEERKVTGSFTLIR